MRMRATPDDPRLTAYLLGELPADDVGEIERAIAADPALRLSLRELEQTVALLDGAFGRDPKQLRPVQREAVMREARHQTAGREPADLKSARIGRLPWLAGLGAAAAVAGLAVLMTRMPAPESHQAGGAGEGVAEAVALLPMPGPGGNGDPGTGPATAVGSDGGEAQAVQGRELDERPAEFLIEVAQRLDRTPTPDADKLPATGDLPGFSDTPELQLPLLVGTASRRWIESWIRERGELPPRDAVRVEEVINACTSHPGTDGDRATLEVRSTHCPWNPGNALALVRVTAGRSALATARLRLVSTVGRRVLGSFHGSAERLPDRLPAGRSTLLMLEFSGPLKSSDLGHVELVQGEDVAIRVAIPGRPGAAAAELRHEVCMAGFALWLRNEGPTTERLEQMLAAAEQENRDPVRADSLRLVHEALALAESRR